MENASQSSSSSGSPSSTTTSSETGGSKSADSTSKPCLVDKLVGPETRQSGYWVVDQVLGGVSQVSQTISNYAQSAREVVKEKSASLENEVKKANEKAETQPGQKSDSILSEVVDDLSHAGQRAAYYGKVAVDAVKRRLSVDGDQPQSHPDNSGPSQNPGKESDKLAKN